MRQSLGTDHSFFSTSNDSSLENDSPITSEEIPDIFALARTRPAAAPKSHTIEKMENNGNQASPCCQHAKKRSGSWGDLPNTDTGLSNPAARLVPTKERDKSSNLSLSGSIGRSVAGDESGDKTDNAASGGRRNNWDVTHDNLATGQINREDKLSDLDQNMAR